MASLAELLSRHPAHLWVGSRRKPAGELIPTGHAELDALLGGGWPRGTLVEVMARGPGLGKTSLLLPALASLTRAGETVAWLSAGEPPYAPALAGAGMDLGRLLVLEAGESRQQLWAAEQCLQSGACAALVMTETRIIADALLRRLKLAAAAGNALLFLLRKDSAADSPSPATLRLRLRGVPDKPVHHLEILKGGLQARTLTLHAADG